MNLPPSPSARPWRLTAPPLRGQPSLSGTGPSNSMSQNLTHLGKCPVFDEHNDYISNQRVPFLFDELGRFQSVLSKHHAAMRPETARKTPETHDQNMPRNRGAHDHADRHGNGAENRISDFAVITVRRRLERFQAAAGPRTIRAAHKPCGGAHASDSTTARKFAEAHIQGGTWLFHATIAKSFPKTHDSPRVEPLRFTRSYIV